MLPAVDVKHKLLNNIPSACRRKNDGRSQRPTALVMCRNRSESPANRSKSRPHDPVSDKWLDMSFIQEELEKKSGLLTFGCESIKAQMEEFEHEALLGHGTCSVVYKMRHRFRPEIVIAVKNMRRSSDDQENKRILMDLHVVTKSSDCAYIVECFGIFLTTTDVWICMEVMSTSLDKLLYDLHRPFPEKVLGKITYSIITALDYLKVQHNVMHRDVKPSNMLLSYQGVVKLCDFGISGKLKDSIARSRQLGCIGYMAPERLSTPAYDVRADIWSLGISLLELATGSFPYTGTEIEFAIMSKIISDPAPSLPHHIPFTKAFRQFVDQCLQKDYHQRPKYSFLMETEFFSRHASEPHDVLDWLRAIPLPHLQPPENHSPFGRRRNITPHFVNSSATPRTSSPTSAATLSPDRVRAFIGTHSPSDSQDGLEVTSGNSRGETLLNVTLVSAPANTNNNNCSDYYHQHSSVSSLHDSSTPSVHGDMSGCGGVASSQPSPPTSYRIVNGDSEKAGTSIRVIASSAKCSDDPSSQASSGYGSSDSSPSVFSVDSRPQNTSASHGPAGKATLPRHMTASPPPSTRTTPSPGPRFQVTVPPATLVGPGLQKPVAPVQQQQPGKATLTQPQTTRLGSLTVTSLVGPLVQAFEQASLVCPAGDRSRQQTNANRDTGSQPAPNPHSPRRSGVQPSSSQQTARSASASTRLQRSHAQRWPASRSPAVRRKTPQQGDQPLLSVSDLRCRCSPPTTDSVSREANQVGAATGQHEFCGNMSLGIRVMTPPLTGQTLRCSENVQYDSLPKPTKSTDYCSGSGGQSVTATTTVPSCRLMHRLNTHPLPRQATVPNGGSSRPAVRDLSRNFKIRPPNPPHRGSGSISHLPPSGCNRVPGNSQATQESETPMTDGVSRGKHSVNGNRTAGTLRSIIPTTNSCSHRSISQPPIFHSGRIPFETEL